MTTRRRVPVAGCIIIGFRENQRLGNIADFSVIGEKREVIFASPGRHRKVRTAKQCAREEQTKIVSYPGQLLTSNQGAPQDDVIALLDKKKAS